MTMVLSPVDLRGPFDFLFSDPFTYGDGFCDVIIF